VQSHLFSGWNEDSIAGSFYAGILPHP